MQIVIKLPDEIVKSIFDGEYCGIIDERVYDAIKHGTPLPKGHGRLIDTEELKKNNEEYIIQYPTDSEENTRNIIVGWINEDIANAPTIIEADKEKE